MNKVEELTVMFNQKLTFMKFLRETLNYETLELSNAEKDIIKSKFVSVLESIDFTPKKYTRKVIVEKHKKATRKSRIKFEEGEKMEEGG